MDYGTLIDLKHLRAFKLVAEELHFGRAAERAYVSTASISGRIKELERALGYDVFVRTSRKVELTEPGRAFLEHVQRSLDTLDRAFALGEPPRPVRAIAIPDIQPPALFAAMGRLHRGKSFLIANEPDLARRIIEDEADIGVCWSAPERLGYGDRLSGRALLEMEMLAVIRSDDPLAQRDALSRQDLSDRTPVLFGRELCPEPFAIMLEFLDIDEGDVHLKAVHSQAGMAAKMLEHDDAFTFGSTNLLPPHLKAVPLSPRQHTTYWALVRHGDEHLIDQLEAFIAEY